MSTATKDYTITSLDELRSLITAPDPNGLVMRKELPHLDKHARAYIAKSPFCLMGTSNLEGRCDVTPRGDAPGFVLVLDDHTLVIPDRPGNRRIDSMQNILDNPHAGLLFLVPGVDETLRVNGRATITNDPALLEQMSMKGKTPLVGVRVEVEEVFFHCARAFKRSKLWDADSQIERSELPTLGQILAEQIASLELDSEKVDEGLAESNRRLY